jgi:hypothetical protein
MSTTNWSQRGVTKYSWLFKTFKNSWSKYPPRGLISSFLIFLTTIGIITILTGMKCHQILSACPSSIDSASEGVDNCILFPSKGECNISGFTTLLANADSEQMNTQVHFDTDSIFFVCDNSTTGHICNDVKKFIPGSLRQSNKSLTSANGTGPCLQEGAVRLQLIDDDGQKHTFILDNCLFHPNSPVNLLSTQCLAEKFIDSNGYPDEQTQIELQYSTHTLIWSFGKFKKTFPTLVSGLPELLFDEGFHEYKSFCTQMLSYAATSGANDSNINVIPFDEDEV